MKPLLIIGCGGHACSIIDLVESTTDWNIIGLVGLPGELNKKVLGYNVIGCDKDLPSLREEFPNALIAVGQIGVSTKRLDLYLEIISLKFNFLGKSIKNDQI